MTPNAFTIQETYLDVGDGHSIYIHEWGNKDAKTPVIALHGGPGSGSSNKHRDVFDPHSQRVIFFDQRGSGKSLPYGSLKHNATPELIDDIKKIADHFELKEFILYGGSWGACLALAYALHHPQRIKAIVLRGIMTGSKAENDYLHDGHWATHYPEVWDAYLDRTPEVHRDDPTAYHTKRMLGKDPQAAKESAYAYACMEGALLTLDDRFTPPDFDEFDPTVATIETYYAANDYFMLDRHIMDNAKTLRMPIYLIQGRYDMVCPPVTAYELHGKLRNSQLIWSTAGHKAEHEGWNIAHTLLLQLTGDK